MDTLFIPGWLITGLIVAAIIVLILLGQRVCQC